jgi:hypothetical protein
MKPTLLLINFPDFGFREDVVEKKQLPTFPPSYIHTSYIYTYFIHIYILHAYIHTSYIYKHTYLRCPKDGGTMHE